MYNYTITENENGFLLNGIEIPNEIFDHDLSDYKIIEREQFLDDLINWISECKNNDKQLMLNDLFMLAKIDDKFILSSINTNHYLYGNSQEFNDKCFKILSLTNDFINVPRTKFLTK